MIRVTNGFVGAVLVAMAAVGASASEQPRAPAAARAPVRHAPPPPGTRIESDIAYGTDPAQQLDLFRPAKAKGAPILVMVHGGGWRRGDKASPGVVDNKVNHWIPKGFIFVSVNYRLVPEADPVSEADDVAKAVAFVQAHAKAWGGDPARVVLMGHSAGAHLVALLTAAPEIVERAGVKPWLGTIALDSAAYDVVKVMQREHFGLYDQAFGADQQLWRTASPTLRLSGAPAAPMLLVCSTNRVDACPPTEEFASKARSLRGQVTVLPVAMTHGDINRQLGTEGSYTASVDAFLESIGLKQGQ